MIHRYKLGGMNIVLDICSGSVHLVDEVAYDMIGLFETESREAITAAMLEKYGDREDMTEATSTSATSRLKSCATPVSSSPPIRSSRWQVR